MVSIITIRAKAVQRALEYQLMRSVKAFPIIMIGDGIVLLSFVALRRRRTVASFIKHLIMSTRLYFINI